MNSETVSPSSSPQLQHPAPVVRISRCIYLQPKIKLTFTLTLLLEIGGKGFDLQRHFVLDVKIGSESNYLHFWTQVV